MFALEEYYTMLDWMFEHWFIEAVLVILIALGLAWVLCIVEIGRANV